MSHLAILNRFLSPRKMGAQYSGLQSLKKNEYIKRLIDTEPIDENDPFWNQLLSFANNIPFSKYGSQSSLRDER